MKLSEFVENPELFLKKLESAQSELEESVDVNSGIRSAEDIRAIINNKSKEKVDWTPLYEYAKKFD